MNLDFSREQEVLREQLQRVLQGQQGLKGTRAALEGRAVHDDALWRKLGELGWLGVAIPQAYGGQGLGYEELCIVAQELGRAVAAVPFGSSIAVVAEALVQQGSEELRHALLPGLASGALKGAFAHAEGQGVVAPNTITAHVEAGRLTGRKIGVADGTEANLFVVSARAGAEVQLFLVQADAPGVVRHARDSLDPSHGQCEVVFDRVLAEPVGLAGWAGIQRLLERAAVSMAFEQLGTADAALLMAREYATERKAFGRAIGSFQAIKHKLADVWMANELARANTYFAAWALQSDAQELPLAAATARVSASEALERAARELIQVLGGIGVTWEHDAHLIYRRGRHLALALGGAPEWADRLAGHLISRN